MAKYLRYALATFCFAASVGCWGLWWRSMTVHDEVYGDSPIGSKVIYFSAFRGAGCIGLSDAPKVPKPWRHDPSSIAGMNIPADARLGPEQFGWAGPGVYFPLWYPALIFALAGVAALRLGRRFTLRSAIIATTVVAGLLGMAVGL